jgi:hypothetical protein
LFIPLSHSTSFNTMSVTATDHGREILQSLKAVTHERTVRIADSALAARVLALKAFQHQRFAHTYGDLLVSPRYGGAARFFLEDLYGPNDFTQRDAQFARVVPALVRLFPNELVATVAALAQLHALSEQLDSAMAQANPSPEWTNSNYAVAWQASGTPTQREQQVSMMLAVGSALDRYTRKPLLRHSLRLMRGPAQAAGLSALQSFLENGFDTFRAMGGADYFLATVAQRERALSAALFAGAA